MQAVRVSTVVAKWGLIGAVAALSCGLADGAVAAIAERAGERVVAGGDQLELSVPAEPGDLLLRFTETGIDLQLIWSIDAEEHQANAPGRRWGEQVMLLPADSPRPERVSLTPLLTQAPAGRVRWQWQIMGSEFDPIERRALALESAAAQLAADGDRAQSERALQLYRQALQLQRQTDSVRWIELSYRVGQLHSRLGDWAAAAAIYRPALAAATDHATIGRLSDGLGYALFRLGEHDQAKSHFERALIATRDDKDAYQFALSSNNSCLPLHAQGDMRAAAECLRKADQAYRVAGIVENRSLVLTNLGAVLTSLGRADDAIEMFYEALQLSGETVGRPSAQAHALVKLHLAWALLDRGRYAEALQQALTGQLEAETAEDHWLLSQLTRVTAATLAAMGESERAVQQLKAILARPALYAGTPDSVRLHYAAARLEADPAERAEQLRQVRSASAAIDDDYTYVRAWLDEAEALMTLGKFELAEAAVQGSLAMARRLSHVKEQVKALGMLADQMEPAQARVSRAEAIRLAEASGLHELHFLLLHAEVRMEMAAGRWMAARSAAERAAELSVRLRQRLSVDEHASLRSRLKTQVHGALAAGVLAPDLDTQAKAQWLWQRLESQRGWDSGQTQSVVNMTGFHELRQLLAGEGSASGKPASATQLEGRRMVLEANERGTAPTAWPDLRQMQAQLSSDETLVVMLLDEPKSAALVLHPDRMTVYALDSAAQLEPAVNVVARGLGRQDPLGEGALQARISRLAAMLQPVLLDLASSTRIRFLPGPGLDRVPLELMLQSSPQTASVVRLSPQTLQLHRLSERDRSDGAFLILEANPNDEQGPGQSWTGLPAVRTEVTALKTMLSGRRVRHQFGAEAVRTLSQIEPDQHLQLVHVAGHALSSSEWSSLDVLAFGDRPEAQFAMGQLRQQRLQAELVVLSACRTALGRQDETGLGFAQAFLAAGARQVIASAWPIDDRATADFMRLFYHAHLIEGLEPVVALTQAQTRMRMQDRWRAPYWWAGFQLWQGVPADGFDLDKAVPPFSLALRATDAR